MNDDDFQDNDEEQVEHQADAKKFSSIITQVSRDNNNKAEGRDISVFTFFKHKVINISYAISDMCRCLKGQGEEIFGSSGHSSILGPPSHRNLGRKTLILDLDETLVHSTFERPAHYDFVVPIVIQGTVLHVFVNIRPAAEYFISKLADKYELVIFTASLSEYADPVIDRIDPDRSISRRLYRESCSPHRGVFVKDLGRIGRHLKDTIIIDNSENSFLFHRENAIHIRSYFDDKSDRDLIELIPFLEFLSNVHDVRPIDEWKIKYDQDNSFEFADHNNNPKIFKRSDKLMSSKGGSIDFDSPSHNKGSLTRMLGNHARGNEMIRAFDGTSKSMNQRNLNGAGSGKAKSIRLRETADIKNKSKKKEAKNFNDVEQGELEDDEDPYKRNGDKEENENEEEEEEEQEEEEGEEEEEEETKGQGEYDDREPLEAAEKASVIVNHRKGKKSRTQHHDQDEDDEAREARRVFEDCGEDIAPTNTKTEGSGSGTNKSNDGGRTNSLSSLFGTAKEFKLGKGADKMVNGNALLKEVQGKGGAAKNKARDRYLFANKTDRLHVRKSNNYEEFEDEVDEMENSRTNAMIIGGGGGGGGGGVGGVGSSKNSNNDAADDGDDDGEYNESLRDSALPLEDKGLSSSDKAKRLQFALNFNSPKYSAQVSSGGSKKYFGRNEV